MEKNNNEIKKPNNKNKAYNRRTIALMISTAVVLLVAVVMFFIIGGISMKEANKEEQRINIIKSGRFHSGITVEGIDVSGLTFNEAKEKLKSVENQMLLQVSYALVNEEKSFTIDYTVFDVRFDTDEVLTEALKIGRSGGLLSLQGNSSTEDIHKNFTISYTLDTANLAGTLDKIADEVFDADRKETRCPAVVDAPVDSHIGINPRWELFLECPAFLKSELNEVDWRRLLRASLYLSISFDLFQQLFK